MPILVNGISCILADGVRETTDTIGTGTYSLRGARTVEGVTYRTVVAGIGSGNKSVFTTRLGAEWESFIGTVTSGTPAQLTRDQILSSSNGGSAVAWGVGDKDLILNVTAAVMHSLQAQLDAIPDIPTVPDAVNRLKTTLFTSNGTLTTDADNLFAWVRVVGAGGAGGGAQVTNSFGAAEGGGGGGGEYAEGYFTAAQLGASKSVTIGTGGTGVSGANGNAGGTTNFGSGLLTALGGAGGSAGAASNGDNSSAPGAGGSGGAGGIFRVPGGTGMWGIVRTYSTWPGPVNFGVRGQMGMGGGSVLGNAKHDPEFQQAGTNYGVGGNGASIGASTASRSGNAGSNGVCIVLEYLHA